MSTDALTIPGSPDGAGSRPHRGRLVLLGLILCFALASSLWLSLTEQGRALLDRQYIASVGQSVSTWVDDNPVAAPLLFLAAYVVCAVFLLPVWWLQVLAGYSFGLVGGVFWTLSGATSGALATLVVARWLGADWVNARAGQSAGKFHRLSEAMGHNGLLVVLAARLCYAVPYGLSNYLFGLTGIGVRDTIVGTVLGLFPVAAAYVCVGARPGLLADWRFWAVVVGVNALLLSPLVWRYFYLKRKRRAAVVAHAAPPAADDVGFTLEHPTGLADPVAPALDAGAPAPHRHPA